MSDNFYELNLIEKIIDYFWHLTLPLLAMIVSGFAGLVFLTKNSFIDQINQQYVMTARAKGLSERKVLYGHVFRNAMLIVIAGFPSAFIGVLFSSSLFIEVIFSLDGLGLLGYEAALSRDYPVIFATTAYFLSPKFFGKSFIKNVMNIGKKSQNFIPQLLCHVSKNKSKILVKNSRNITKTN